MNIEFILNHALNKALCSKQRIKQPNSNNVAEFVSLYLKTEQLTIPDVVKSLPNEIEVGKAMSELSDIANKEIER